MKKTLFLLLALSCAGLSSCRKGVPTASLNTKMDTLSYLIGASSAGDKQTIGLFLASQGADSLATEEFAEGLAEGVLKGYDAMAKLESTDDKTEKSYQSGVMQGVQLATQMLAGIEGQFFANSEEKISRENFAAGFADMMNGTLKITKDGKPLDLFSAQKMTQDLLGKYQEPELLKKYGNVKKAGEDFMAVKAKEAGIQRLPSGVLYKVISTGNGAKPKLEQTVEVTYEGRLTDGTVFDATKNHGRATDEFPLGSVIPGWQEAIAQMPVGARWEIYIPYQQAYGLQQTDKIPPFSALVFDVTLVGIK